MTKPLLSDRPYFYELQEIKSDHKFLSRVKECILMQHAAGKGLKETFFKANPNSLHEVSEDRLNEITRSGEEISDIRTKRAISNCIAFNSRNLEGSVLDKNLLALRREIDRALSSKLQKIFGEGKRLNVQDSGHFWYPEGAFMGWHTNHRTPGWRMYINYAVEPGKSFFRYRDPKTGEIKTLWDEEWNFRLFHISEQLPLWHSVYSQTDRFSIGYRILIQPKLSFKGKLRAKIAQLLPV